MRSKFQHSGTSDIRICPLYIQGVSKMLQVQEWVPHTKQGKTFISIYVSKQFSRNGLEILPTQSFRFLSLETLKTLVYSAPVENEETLQRSIFYAHQNICNRSGTTVWDSPLSDVSMRTLIRLEDIPSIYCELQLEKQ